MFRACHPASAGLAIAMVWFGTAWGAEETTVPMPDSGALVAKGRAMLRSGKAGDAQRLIARALDSSTDDVLWCLAGEIQFRRGDFQAATRAFRTALDRNPRNARAWWGLGRIEQIYFRPTT